MFNCVISRTLKSVKKKRYTQKRYFLFQISRPNSYKQLGLSIDRSLIFLFGLFICDLVHFMCPEVFCFLSARLESILSKLKRFEYLFSGFFSVFLDANEYEIKLWNWFALFSLNKCIVLLNSYIFLNNLDMIVFSEKENILVINETNLFWQVYSSLVF